MKSQILPLILTLSLVACQDNEVTGSINSCAANSYMKYNPKDLKQCVEVCQKCDHGTPISCSTSCSFKGAR